MSKTYKTKKIQVRMMSPEGKLLDLTKPFPAKQITPNLYVHKRIDPDTQKPTRKRKGIDYTLTMLPLGAAFKHLSEESEVLKLGELIAKENFNFDKYTTPKEFLEDKPVSEKIHSIIIDFIS